MENKEKRSLTQEELKKMCSLKSYVFTFSQKEELPETGEHLIDEKQIYSGLSHKSISKYAYVRHDKDVHTEDDPEGKWKKGDPKDIHWHVVIRTGTNQLDIGTISKWFGVSPQIIRIQKGRSAFLDCVEYLTHEHPNQQAKGKYLYPDEEIHTNFDFRAELNARNERKIKYGKDLQGKDLLRAHVLQDGYTLKQAYQEDPLGYQNDVTTLSRLRSEYLSRFAKTPDLRINYYIEGASGAGKSVVSRAIARVLIDPDHKMEDDDIFFVVGSNNVTFEGYDGQPVIIWDDCRIGTLMTKLGSRENVFNVFDPHPVSMRQNVKNSSVKLVNCINIVNSVQSWRDFLNGMSGEYKDKDGTIHKAEDSKQGYRRFPFFLVIHADDYDLGVNDGFIDPNGDFNQFHVLQNVTANFKKLIEIGGNNIETVNLLTDTALSPVVDKYAEVKEISNNELAQSIDVNEYVKTLGKTDKDWKSIKTEREEK